MTNWKRGTSIRFEERALHPTNEGIQTLAGWRLSEPVTRMAAADQLGRSERVAEGSARYKRETAK